MLCRAVDTSSAGSVWTVSSGTTCCTATGAKTSKTGFAYCRGRKVHSAQRCNSTCNSIAVDPLSLLLDQEQILDQNRPATMSVQSITCFNSTQYKDWHTQIHNKSEGGTRIYTAVHGCGHHHLSTRIQPQPRRRWCICCSGN